MIRAWASVVEARLLWALLGRCGLAGCRRLSGRPFSLPTRLFLLLGAQFAGYRQRLADPALALFGGALTGRGLPPAERARIAIDLGAQVSHRLLGRAPAPLQGRVSAERGGSGRCARPDAVLGDPVQAGDASPDQGGEAVDQQALQERAVVDPEVGQRLGVHAAAAA